MGAGLGAALALSLALSSSRDIAAMIAHSAEPANTFAVFVGAFAVLCAVGATLTGLIFLMIEEGER